MLNWEEYGTITKNTTANVKLFVQSNMWNIKHVQAGIYKIKTLEWD